MDTTSKSQFLEQSIQHNSLGKIDNQLFYSKYSTTIVLVKYNTSTMVIKTFLLYKTLCLSHKIYGISCGKNFNTNINNNYVSNNINEV